MTMNLIMAVCMYPALLILYGVMRAQAKPRGGLLFGARLPECWTKDAELERVDRRFKRQLLLVLLVLAVISLTFFAVPYMSVSLTLWMVWLFAVIAAVCLPFAGANRAVRGWKAAHGLAGAAGGERLIELGGAEAVRKVRFLPFLPALLLSLAAVVMTAVGLRGQGLAGMTAVQACFALCTLIYYLAAWWMDRQRLRVISGNSEVNLNYNRARRQLWKNFWLFCAWINTGLVLVTACLLVFQGLEAGMRATLWGSVAYMGLLLGGIVALAVKQSGLDGRYRDRMDLPAAGDDDGQWIGGMIYYNPRDRRVSVEKRVGIGTTVNMATPAGKALAAFLAAVLLGVALMCVWIMRLEFTPIRLSVTENAVVAVQLREDYRIPLDTVESLELVEELPGCTRVNGTGMSSLYKGTFRVRDTGERCQLFLNPGNGVFICFTSEGMTYYMSGADDAQTLEVYRQMASSQ